MLFLSIRYYNFIIVITIFLNSNSESILLTFCQREGIKILKHTGNVMALKVHPIFVNRSLKLKFGI